jgi:hypothetical protein
MSRRRACRCRHCYYGGVPSDAGADDAWQDSYALRRSLRQGKLAAQATTTLGSEHGMTTSLSFMAASPRRNLGLSLLFALGGLSGTVQGADVAMVTDLQGRATAAREGLARDLTILAELDAGTVVQLTAGATLVALYLDAGDEYVFTGPATIAFLVGQPEIQAGSKPQRRPLTLGTGSKDIRIKPVGLAQAATVMRSNRSGAPIQALGLSDTRTLETQPEFRWTAPRAALTYRFELNDETGRVVFASQVNATSVKLPAGVQLREAVPYKWKVSYPLADGRQYSSSAEFTVASADVRGQAAALRPGAAAPLSSRIAYAAWLESMELRDEARKYWKAAAAERPQDLQLEALAAQ